MEPSNIAALDETAALKRLPSECMHIVYEHHLRPCLHTPPTHTLLLVLDAGGPPGEAWPPLDGWRHGQASFMLLVMRCSEVLVWCASH